MTPFFTVARTRSIELTAGRLKDNPAKFETWVNLDGRVMVEYDFPGYSIRRIGFLDGGITVFHGEQSDRTTTLNRQVMEIIHECITGKLDEETGRRSG